MLSLSWTCGAESPAPRHNWGPLRSSQYFVVTVKCMARDKEEELKHDIPRHRVPTVCLRQVIAIQTEMPTMLGHWGLPVQLAWGKTTHTPVPAQLEKEFSIPECRLGKGVFAATPSSPSPHPSLKQLRKAPALFISRKVQSKSLPGERSLEGSRDPGQLQGQSAAHFPEEPP